MTLFIVEVGSTDDLDSGFAIPKVVGSWESARQIAAEGLMAHLEASTEESDEVAIATALDDLNESYLRFTAAFGGFEVDIAPVYLDPDSDDL